MNYKLMGRFQAFLFGALAVFMVPAMILCFADADTAAGLSFLYVLLGCALVAAVLLLCCKDADHGFFAKEGFVCVGVAWILISVISALPLRISGCVPTYIDALFEMASGFSTTGASVIADVESLPRGILYWRSFSHWLGGMGILVFLLAVIPMEGKKQGFTLHLMRAESPGPSVGKLVPKIKKTASILYITYIILTVANFIFLLFDMPAFEALCTAMGTAGTGGFGVKNDSLTGYSNYVQIVTTVFMFLFAVNFGCYYLIILGKIKNVLKDEELRAFIIIVACSVLFITCNLFFTQNDFTQKNYETVGKALKDAAFQVASIVSTTGYSTADFDLWPAFSKAVLLFLMVIGACAGSTGGGLKCSRLLILVKGVVRNVKQALHPQKVATIRINNKTVEEKTVESTNSYFVAYVSILVVSFLLISLDKYVGGDPTTAFTAVLACFNNIGPGLAGVGPTANFSGFSAVSKLIFVFDMLAGRLEIYPILILFSGRVWKRA